MTIANDADRVCVTIRNARDGHLTAALPLDALPAFIDEHLAAGKAVVAESGDASLVVWTGRDILDFFLRWRRALAVKPKEAVTVLNAMKGGVDAGEVGMEAPSRDEVAARVLAAALGARGGQGGQGGNGWRGEPPQPTTAYDGRQLGRPLDAAAEMRAWQGLVDKEGESAVSPLLHGGAIAVRSFLWTEVVYLVRPDVILVAREGQIVTRLCLQLADGGPIWDAVANRLSLLRAGIEGEFQVWATANVV